MEKPCKITTEPTVNNINAIKRDTKTKEANEMATRTGKKNKNGNLTTYSNSNNNNNNDKKKYEIILAQERLEHEREGRLRIKQVVVNDVITNFLTVIP